MASRSLGALLAGATPIVLVSVGYLAATQPGVFAVVLFIGICLGSAAYWLDRLTETP